MKHTCSICSKSFASKDSLNQHSLAAHKKSEGNKKRSKKGLYSVLIISIVLVVGIGFFSSGSSSENLDSFAQCLTDKGAVVYGNNHCSFTVQQLNFFGRSQKLLNYVKCSDNEALCDEKGISITPTWEYNGRMYEQVQDFEKLSAITGCSYK